MEFYNHGITMNHCNVMDSYRITIVMTELPIMIIWLVVWNIFVFPSSWE